MSEVKIRHQNDRSKVHEEPVLDDIQNQAIDTNGIEKVFQGDANIFLLNNLMMSVQFFENYERDIKLLRENWFKEFLLESHHKTCFYADSLFRLSAANVKFSPRHGVNKYSESPLHPFRVYISSDNVEAAFDPAALGRDALKVWPEYQFTVRTDEKAEKSGCITLVEFKTVEEPSNSTRIKRSSSTLSSYEAMHRNSIYIQNKSNLEEKSARRFTKTEMSIGFLAKDQNPKAFVRRCSIKYSLTPDDTIPVNGFYKFEDPEKRLMPKMIQDVRMYSEPGSSHEIPQKCFQFEEVRNKLSNRRTGLNACFRTQRVLNSAAFKGYFCDLLADKLPEALNLDPIAVEESQILEEFVVVNENGAQHYITPVVTIRDWNRFVGITRFRKDERSEELTWPSGYMQEIMKILPCNAVPTWHSCPSVENLDYEKSWKLVFPKTEEFLLLHMMHAHIRCYFFVLLIYKSFIEPRINGSSFGPRHLMHLLFWKVHRNFLAWPEDRPAETFLGYLKTLYKKLQNKYLCDFFITSRNLFSSSFPKDLHLAQSVIQRIIENPVPYLIRAISHLRLKQDFYPSFDYLKLNKILSAPPLPVKIKTVIKKEKRKKVHFQIDEEQLWKKNVIKQIESEKKTEIEKDASKLSIDSVNVTEILNFDSDDWEKCDQILQMFTSHFLQMGSKSMEYDSVSQGLMYLYQTQKLYQLMASRGMKQDTLKETREKINELKQSCYGRIKQELRKSPGRPKQIGATKKKTEDNLENREQGKEVEIKEEVNRKNEETFKPVAKDSDGDEIICIKL